MPKKILIVDDEPNIVIPLEFMMKQSGYEVSTACNGDQLFAAMDSEQPDLILLDVMLPGMDGFEICHTIRANHNKNMKIILLTARSREVDIKKGLGMGANAYIKKPFSTKDLMYTIQQMIN